MSELGLRQAAWMTAAIVGAAAAGLWAGVAGVLAVALAAVGVAVGLVVARAWRDSGASSRSPASTPEVEDVTASFMDGLWGWLGLGFALRLVLVLVVNASPLWRSFGPDAIAWEERGRLVLAALAGPTHSLESTSSLWTFYPILNAAAVAVFDHARYPVSFINCIVGTACALLAGRLAHGLFGRAVGRRAFLLVLFYPSLLLWGAMNIRDVWAHAGILLVLLAGHNARERFAPISLAVLVGSILFLYFIRPYLLGLLVVAVVASLLIVRPRQLPYALLAFGLLVPLMQTYGDAIPALNEGMDEQLETIQSMRQGLAYGGSAYGAEADTRTLSGALSYLPYGLAKFLFSPFPWDVRSWQQALALPESLAFFVLMTQAVRRIVGDLARRASRVALPVSLLIVITIAYALVSGNEGTAFRHRAQIVVIVLIFSAAQQVKKREGATAASASSSATEARRLSASTASARTPV